MYKRDLTRPQLFKRWITLSNREISASFPVVLLISDLTSPVKLVGKIRPIALGSKPSLVIRVARTGLGTRLDKSLSRS